MAHLLQPPAVRRSVADAIGELAPAPPPPPITVTATGNIFFPQDVEVTVEGGPEAGK
jgi:hypothetical protein